MKCRKQSIIAIDRSLLVSKIVIWIEERSGAKGFEGAEWLGWGFRPHTNVLWGKYAGLKYQVTDIGIETLYISNPNNCNNCY